jgi:hypothetical protein
VLFSPPLPICYLRMDASKAIDEFVLDAIQGRLSNHRLTI